MTGTIAPENKAYFLPVSEPIEVDIIDAAGRAQKTMSTATGAFSFQGVRLPYDIAVHGPPDATTSRKQSKAYFGLKETSPQVTVQTLALNQTYVTTTFTLNFTLPACPAGESYCSIQVASKSAHQANGGNGKTDYYYPSSSTAHPVSYDHIWTVDSPGASETIAMEVLVRAPGSGLFWHSSAVSSVNGATGSSLSLTPSALPVFGNVTVSAKNAAAFSRDWSLRTTISLVPPGFAQAAWTVGDVNALSLVAAVPNLPGAQIQPYVSAQRNSDISTPVQERWATYASATQAPAPLSTTNLAQTLMMPPEDFRPQPNTKVPASGGKVSWTPTAAQSARIDFEWADHWVVEVLTNGTEVPFERLVALGLPAIGAGSRYLVSEFYEPVDLDKVVSPSLQSRQAFNEASKVMLTQTFSVE